MEGNEREGSVAGQFHNFGLNLLLCFKVFTTRDSYSIRILTMTKMMMMLCCTWWLGDLTPYDAGGWANAFCLRRPFPGNHARPPALSGSPARAHLRPD